MPRDEGPYEVGFGKPPKAHQFRKGQSGNRNGRPKHSRSKERTMLESLNRTVKVVEDGRPRIMTKLEVIVETTIHKAMQGDRSARAEVFKFVEKYSRDKAEADRNRQSGPLILPGLMDRDEWMKMVAKTQAKARGETPEE